MPVQLEMSAAMCSAVIPRFLLLLQHSACSWYSCCAFALCGLRLVPVRIPPLRGGFFFSVKGLFFFQ